MMNLPTTRMLLMLRKNSSNISTSRLAKSMFVIYCIFTITEQTTDNHKFSDLTSKRSRDDKRKDVDTCTIEEAIPRPKHDGKQEIASS